MLQSLDARCNVRLAGQISFVDTVTVGREMRVCEVWVVGSDCTGIWRARVFLIRARGSSGCCNCHCLAIGSIRDGRLLLVLILSVTVVLITDVHSSIGVQMYNRAYGND